MYPAPDYYKVLKDFATSVSITSNVSFKTEYLEGDILWGKESDNWIKEQIRIGNIVWIEET